MPGSGIHRARSAALESDIAAGRRRFDESVQAARSRAEIDPWTRLRITLAHELVAEAAGEKRSAARHVRRLRMLVPRPVLYRAGLTLGEARAAGLRVGL